MSASPAPAVATESVLSIRGLSKTFPSQKALDDVDLDIRPGEVHCLLGQNGCGKSTLIKILAGYHTPDHGSTATFSGRPFQLGSPARDRGIAFIHQDLGLVAELDAVDNLALGSRFQGRWWLSKRREWAAAGRMLAELDIDLDPRRAVAEATPGEQTMLAIARAVSATGAAPELLVLDEPTAALPGHQVAQLFDLVRQLRDRGTAILYVTHRLREVFEIGDRATILRDGRNITTRPVAEIDGAEGLIRLIIGRDPVELAPPVPVQGSEVLLDVEGVRGGQVENFRARVRAGEIVGVTGLIGSGYDQALGLVFGGRRREAGRVRLAGEEVRANRPDLAIAAGMVYAPADRKRLSTIASWSLRENVTLPRVPSRGLARWLGARHERREVLPWLARMDVVPADTERQLSLLSGGNQQKVVLARWLRTQAQVLMLDEPTSGVDAGAKASIYEVLAGIAAQGQAVVIATSDAEELCAICDRVLVMRNGEVCVELVKDDLSVARIVGETIRDTTDQHSKEVQP